MHDLDYLVTLTRLGHFPTELSRQIAVEKGINTVEALNIFVEGEERIRKVADALPDIYRESDPAVRRQQARDYLKRMEEK